MIVALVGMPGSGKSTVGRHLARQLGLRLADEDELAAQDAELELTADEPEAPHPDSPEHLVNEMRVEPLELEISYDLIDLVDAARGGDLLDRVKSLRRKLALELGVVIPLVRTRDNMDLPQATYVIRVAGVEVACRGEDRPTSDRLAVSDCECRLSGDRLD